MSSGISAGKVAAATAVFVGGVLEGEAAVTGAPSQEVGTPSSVSVSIDEIQSQSAQSVTDSPKFEGLTQYVDPPLPHLSARTPDPDVLAQIFNEAMAISPFWASDSHTPGSPSTADGWQNLSHPETDQPAIDKYAQATALWGVGSDQASYLDAMTPGTVLGGSSGVSYIKSPTSATVDLGGSSPQAGSSAYSTAASDLLNTRRIDIVEATNAITTSIGQPSASPQGAIGQGKLGLSALGVGLLTAFLSASQKAFAECAAKGVVDGAKRVIGWKGDQPSNPGSLLRLNRKRFRYQQWRRATLGRR